MYCGYCGAELEDNAEFCGSCGKPALKPENTPEEQARRASAAQKKKNSRSATRLISCAVMAVVAVATVFCAKGAVNRRADRIAAVREQNYQNYQSTQQYPQDGYYQDGYYQDGYYQDGYYQDGYYQDGYYQDGYYQDGYYQDGYYQDGTYQDGNYQDGSYQDGTYQDTPQYTQEELEQMEQLAAVREYLRTYSGDWKVDMYFDQDEREWEIYELGKRLFIAGYNFFNDGSYTTGGYEEIVGYEEEYTAPSGGGICPSCKTGRMSLMTGLDAILGASSSNTYVCDFCGHTQVMYGTTKKTPIYEYVPEEYHEYHGKDIEYNPPGITITEDSIDMTGMGGTVYDLTCFKLEEIHGREYLVNEESEFAFIYEGDYLEYCEQDYSGQYQGYYAFR